MLAVSPATPPASESSTDSVNSWRRMRLRLEPRARRKATSRERSAARAANMKTRPRQRIRVITFIFGIAFFQIRIRGVQIGSGLRRSDSRLQTPHHLKHPTGPAGIQYDLVAG